MSHKTESSCQPPSAHTFSFTAPFPAAESSSSVSPPSPNTSSLLKQRRVSLALPSSPRLVPAWNFRDDTGLASHVAETSAVMPERRGKMRKIADDSYPRDKPDGFIIQQKKQRKKWSEEETQMLVDGCNTVRLSIYPCPQLQHSSYLHASFAVGSRQLESHTQRSKTEIR
jgi:hypothetical protein